jgi:hypothetical protein
MEYRGLRIAKSILLRFFVLGYLLLIVAWLLWLGMRDQLLALSTTTWHIQNPAFLETATLGFFAMAKFVLIFYGLVPALAICWTLKKLEKKPL